MAPRGGFRLEPSLAKPSLQAQRGAHFVLSLRRCFVGQSHLGLLRSLPGVCLNSSQGKYTTNGDHACQATSCSEALQFWNNTPPGHVPVLPILPPLPSFNCSATDASYETLTALLLAGNRTHSNNLPLRASLEGYFASVQHVYEVQRKDHPSRQAGTPCHWLSPSLGFASPDLVLSHCALEPERAQYQFANNSPIRSSGSGYTWFYAYHCLAISQCLAAWLCHLRVLIAKECVETRR